MTKEDLVTDNTASPAVENDNVNDREFDTLELDNDFDAFKASLERQGVKTDHVEARTIESAELTEDDFYNDDYKNSSEFAKQSDEATDTQKVEDTEQKLDSDDISDVNPDIEVEDGNQEAKETDLANDVSKSAEIDVMSYDELYDQVKGIEIGNEVYTPAQLKAILGQEVSAGTKAREAAERLKGVEARETALEEEFLFLDTRKVATKQSEEMSRIESGVRSLQQELMDSPVEEVYDSSVIRNKIEREVIRYKKLKKEHDQIQRQVDHKRETDSSAALKQEGYGYLLADNTRSRAWSTYASEELNLTPKGILDATHNPGYTIAIEKSRKWDEAQNKDVKKLRSNAKTPKTSGKFKQQSNANKLKKQNQRIKSGQASKEEIEAFLMQQGRSQFK